MSAEENKAIVLELMKEAEQRVSYRMVECFTLAGGKVIEFRFLPDGLSLLQQT